jgi:hypothetical protein
LTSKADIETIIKALRYPEDPLVERTSIFLLYRAWAHNENLLHMARTLSRDARQYAKGSKSTRHFQVLSHFRADIEAQLIREAKQKQRYLGFETFVKMSAGFPRALLTILKYIFTWSLFFGEQPFEKGCISVRAQREGVAQAAEWFYSDARAPGPTGALVRDAMTRLGQLLREIRFSDKPTECSLCTFSANLSIAGERAIEVMREAENWSMLLRIPGGQHDRNVGRVDEKYQVHPMLAPRWDLPISRRGALALSGEEVTAIFSPPDPSDYEEVIKRRVATMMAPFFGKPPRSETLPLPGLNDD